LDAVNVVVGLLNLLVLGWIAWLGYRVQHQLTQIEESRRTDEVGQRKQAEVTARIDRTQETTGTGARTTTTTRHYLVIRNQGPAAARQVNIEVSAPHGHTPTLLDMSGLPIPLLDPTGEIRLILAIAMGDGYFLDVTLSWEDDDGPEKKTLRLTI
jgi:hypothetical protein